MKALIACDEPAVTTLLRTALRSAARDWHVSDATHRALLHSARTKSEHPESMVVFYASRQFSPEDFANLQQLCSTAGSHLKVVAVSAVSKPDVILSAIRCGAVDFIDLGSNLESEMQSLLSRLSLTHATDEPIGRLITVLSPSGGSGASLIATNLAAAIAQRESTCGLIDLRLRGGDLATMLKCAPKYTLLSLAAKEQQLDRAMFDQCLAKHACGIHLLASPEPFSDYRQISAQLIQRILRLARSSFPSVIVDAEDAEHAEQVRTLAQSTQIVIPLRLDFAALCRAKKYLDHLTRSTVNPESITLVASRTGCAKELPVSRVAEVLGMPILHSIPDAAGIVNTSINLGVPLVIDAPKTPVAKAIIRLAESLMGLAKPVAESDSGFLRRVSAKATELFASNMLAHPAT